VPAIARPIAITAKPFIEEIDIPNDRRERYELRADPSVSNRQQECQQQFNYDPTHGICHKLRFV
jgi:hypothetical protein